MYLIKTASLFRADVLQLLGRVQKVVGIRLGSELARVGLLNKVLVALLLSKVNGILLGLKVHVRSLHEVARRLPAHQRVLPSVALGKDIPVHAPVVSSPRSGLCCRLRLLEDSAPC